MSRLIDEIIFTESGSQCEIDGRWYIAKGYPYWTFQLQWRRVKDAFRVLIGKSRAYHYKADEGTGQ